MLTRFGRRPIFNIVRFMSCGKGSKDKCGSNSDGKYSETQCKQKCGTKESNCENRCAEENGVIDWRSKICKSPVKFSTSAIPEIDLSDPCGKRCKPPPPPPEPEECCICYDDIEFCPVTEGISGRIYTAFIEKIKKNFFFRFCPFFQFGTRVFFTLPKV